MNTDDELDKILFKIRTTHEVEHNDNKWTTEFVYTPDETRQAIKDLIYKARINEAKGLLSTTLGDTSNSEIWERIEELKAQLKGDN